MPDERHSAPLLCGQSYVRADGVGDDEAIAQLATQQHGVVARQQLVALGMHQRAIENRLARGRLRRVFRGTYAVGHTALSVCGRICAGVLASAARALGAPPHSAASHISAAAFRKVADSHPGAVHVTSPVPLKGQPGLTTHRSILPAGEIEIVGGVPVTTMARTLLDLSGSMDRRGLRRVLKRAEFAAEVSSLDLEQILERYPRRKGRGHLAALVDEGIVGSGRTRSELEDEFLALCRRNRIPRPETNFVLHVRGVGFEVDCAWRDRHLIVELDGWQAHRGRLAFEDDRARDLELATAGWRVVRVTWRHLRDEAALTDRLRTLLVSPGT